MGSKALSIYRAISEWPISPQIKFRLIQLLRNGAYSLRALRGAPRQRAALLMSNEGYGHEYWLRKYAEFTKDIHAQIEHGLYFGGVTFGRNPIRTEPEIGAFITYSPYREKVLSGAYPTHKIGQIGPYIQYADTDSEYLCEITDMLDDSKKTITLFPTHSASDGKVQFSHNELIESVKVFAREEDYGNLMVALSPMDYSSDLASLYKDEGFIVVCSGQDALRFLPRQRAIMEASDLTVSNDLGTHIGYSLAMSKPHAVIDPVSMEQKIESNLLGEGIDRGLFRKERDEILDAFSSSKFDGHVSSEQRSLYDYYWGGQIKLSPDEMRDLLEEFKQRRA